MAKKTKAKALFTRILQWCEVDTVLSGLGFGVPSGLVRSKEHPGSLWAVETGSTLLVDVSDNPNSEETLLRLCKQRRSIAVFTALTVLMGIITMTQLVVMTDLIGLALLGTVVSGAFLASRVSAHEESRRHVFQISTDPTAVRHGIEGDSAKEGARAGEMLAQALRQFAANEAFVPENQKRELIARVSQALRPSLPMVDAQTVHSATSDITDVLANTRRPQ